MWIDGLFTVRDNNGQEKMLTHYSRRDPNNALGAQVEHGLARFNDSLKISFSVIKFMRSMHRSRLPDMRSNTRSTGKTTSTSPSRIPTFA